MKQNLQFNTVLKFLITVGDLLIMNALFFFLYQLFDKATLGKGLTYSVPQILVLLNLVYLVCNYQNGVILYRRIVRPDHIIRKSLRNVGLLALVFTTLYALAHFGKLSVRFFSDLLPAVFCYPVRLPYHGTHSSEALPPVGRKFPAADSDWRRREHARNLP